MFRRFTPACHAAAVALCAGPALAQSCTPHWADDLWASAPPGEVRALTVHDDGSGARLYMGSAGADGNNAIAVWDRTRLTLLGSVTGSLSSSNSTGVYALAVFDDGSGPALHIAGNFTAVNGVAASCAARLSATGWESLGTGTDSNIRALAVFDDGSGPGLYAGGLFQIAGGAPASAIAKWDGHDWSALGAGVTGGAVQYLFNVFPIVYSLCVFDDGSGPALYAGGNFSVAGGAPALAIARWTGTAWEPVGNGLSWLGVEQGVVVAMTRFDGLAGPSLYAAGRFNFGPQNQNPLVARWDGVSWHPVASWIQTGYLTSLGVADFWGTPTLHTGAGSVFRLSEEGWVTIGSSTSTVRALTSFNDGGGNHLVAGGAFTSLVPSSYTPRVARWDSKYWSPLPYGGAVQAPDRLKVLDMGEGPRLFAIGAFDIAGHPLSTIGRFDGTTWTAVGPGGLSAPYDIEVFDDGTGPMLYAATTLGAGTSYSPVARLNGNVWEPVGLATAPTPSYSGANVLRAFDDGTGSRLFAGGSFDGGIRAWDGVAWATVGAGLPIASGNGWPVRDLESFDAGAGARLYAAWGANLSRWTGDAWEPLAIPIYPNGSIYDLAVFDDGAGTALYAAGSGPAGSILRYDGGSWSGLGHADDIVRTLAAFDDSTGPSLYAAGRFRSIGGVSADRIARWRAGAWSAVGGGLGGEGESLAMFHLPAPSLWVSGLFLTAGGQSSGYLARWVGCPSCYPDCDGSGALTVTDFACFQSKFSAGASYADCNGDAAFTVADFGCFQSRFVSGCP